MKLILTAFAVATLAFTGCNADTNTDNMETDTDTMSTPASDIGMDTTTDVGTDTGMNTGTGMDTGTGMSTGTTTMP